MKVAVYQTNPRLLDVSSNLLEIIDKIRHGRENGANLCVFPELALTGYFVGQRFHEVARRLDSPEIKKIARATRGTAAVVGFIEESKSMNFYNAALVAVDGEILFAYRKLNLPNYGVFEERKLFSCGKRIITFRLMGFTIAVFICNDLWHPSLSYLGVTKKADIFICLINSSREAMGCEFSNVESWEIINTFYSRVFGIYNVVANRVGEERPKHRRSTNGVCVYPDDAAPVFRFWGGSEIINPFGKSIVKAKLDEPDEVTADISRDLIRQKRILLPYLRNDDPYFTHRELERFLFEKPKR